MDGADPTPTPVNAPAIVFKSQPEGSKQRATAKLLFAIASIILVAGIVPPVWTISRSQHRSDLEVDCRSRIATALDAAQATLIAEQARTVVLLGQGQRGAIGDNLVKLQHDIDNVDALAGIRAQATSLCNDDPNYNVPSELIQEVT